MGTVISALDWDVKPHSLLGLLRQMAVAIVTSQVSFLLFQSTLTLPTQLLSPGQGDGLPQSVRLGLCSYLIKPAYEGGHTS